MKLKWFNNDTVWEQNGGVYGALCPHPPIENAMVIKDILKLLGKGYVLIRFQFSIGISYQFLTHHQQIINHFAYCKP